jgi:RIP metalloprotease RseP
LNIVVTALSIIGAVLVICIIVVVHEYGHYSIGRACKIKIVEFAVGFGPKIKSWVKNDIIYSIRWLPLGGFTKFYGEDEESEITAAVKRLLNDALERAEESPLPASEALVDAVFASPEDLDTPHHK